jgi:adenylate cyclase
MQPNLARKLTLICIFTCFAGVMYQLVAEQLLNYNSAVFGLPLGLAFGFLELFVFSKAESRLRQWSFTKMLFFKTVLYTGVIYIVTLSITIIVGFLQGHKLNEIPALMVSGSAVVLTVYTLVIYGLLIFFLQVNHLLGEGILWKFVRGKYHKPREEERIFMFLDMKSSTTIAERLGHVRFYALLNELFHEISYPVLQTKAEIYQYVGDEVVLTWEVDNGLENCNCLQTFFMFRERLQKNRDNYLKNFGVNPEFKAGLHFGKVISAQIGDLKREIVYNGDVVNTTARIQSECNNYQRDCLVSGALMERLRNMNGFQWEKIGAVTFRGKETQVELYSVVS